MPRSPLPPPPPPPHFRTWQNRAALLADRYRALEELRRHRLGVHRILLLWLLALTAIIGWALLMVPLEQFEEHDPLGFVLAPLFALLGLAALAPPVVAVVLAVRRDREVRRLLDAWLALDSHPGTDARLRSPGLSLGWLLSSLGVCAAGLWAAFGTAAGAEPGRTAYADVALGMGAGTILWLTGLLGAANAVRHYRWALRALGATPVPEHR
ncbi:hypothetical protein [Streptomyces sp. MUM 2J]|uniref:hypothetical protein n=1 Tax=Streptomyces sp. MUM 2J TaxID=2791987 RepID=UPI001F04D330|nr:hypothetical protein [Streptomyces sp. MUM 2J]MCH0563969.1 hypothetical protein [Streptomyces sp. MUM 2J]